MTLETIIVLGVAVAAFAAFGLALAYVNAVAGDQAITAEQERALRA